MALRKAIVDPYRGELNRLTGENSRNGSERESGP